MSLNLHSQTDKVVLCGTLQLIDSFVALKYPSLQTRVLLYGEQHLLEVTRIKSDISVSNGGPSSVVSVRVLSTGELQFRVCSETVETSVCFSPGLDFDPSLSAELLSALEKLGDIYVFCYGIPDEEFKVVCRGLGSESKRVVHRVEPFRRYSGPTCKLWFPLRSRATAAEKNDALVGTLRCTECNAVYRRLRSDSKKYSADIQDRKRKRVQPDSHYPIALLSPRSKKLRHSALRTEKKKNNLKLQRLHQKLQEKFVIALDEDQSKELSDYIEQVPQKDIDGLFEQMTEDAGPDITETIKAAFEQDQARNKTGSFGNRWSMTTYRIALSIYTRSPAAYNALKSWGILQLPSKRSLDQFRTTLLHGRGPYFDFLEDQAVRYTKFKEERMENGKPVPLGEGVLILDEVKVIGKIAWSSKTDKICGVVMEEGEFQSLADLYADLQAEDDIPKAAEYFLQFLWRDMSSSYDVIGPHYSSDKSLDTGFTYTCLVEALDAFQAYAFKVVAVVMDGASTNLTMAKVISGQGKGAYGLKNDQEDPHEVKPWFQNPQHLGELIHIIMCPTHQLKNMVNQLWASRDGGAKRFLAVAEGGQTIQFGWKAIIEMWDRERSKRDNDQIRMVPNLIQGYIERDAWTKLNVKPAKIMQQQAVLSELYSYANPDGRDAPADAPEVMETYHYLKALNSLFENGLLNSQGFGRSRITHMQSPPLRSIEEGFQFFRNWCDQLHDQFEDIKMTWSREKRFLAWQTYDLLRLCVYSFKHFCEYYLERHPGYYIVPLKVNGSAIESLFSQIKYNAGGKLTSLNYAQAKRSVMLRRDIHGHHASGRGYRDDELYLHDIPLRRRHGRNRDEPDDDADQN